MCVCVLFCLRYCFGFLIMHVVVGRIRLDAFAKMQGRVGEDTGEGMNILMAQW